jgi:hypothetical protein
VLPSVVLIYKNTPASTSLSRPHLQTLCCLSFTQPPSFTNPLPFVLPSAVLIYKITTASSSLSHFHLQNLRHLCFPQPFSFKNPLLLIIRPAALIHNPSAICASLKTARFLLPSVPIHKPSAACYSLSRLHSQKQHSFYFLPSSLITPPPLVLPSAALIYKNHTASTSFRHHLQIPHCLLFP